MKRNRIGMIGLLAAALVSLGGVSYTPLVQVVPGPGMPAEVHCQGSNNNLDIVRFQGRLFLAFRTAPTHFASSQTRLYIVSTQDEKNWEYETEVFMGYDMREPRFLALGDKLMFYYFRAGKNPFGFAPDHIYALERQGLGEWTSPVPVFEPKCVLWRAKVRNGKAYVSIYCGADKEYTGGNEEIGIRFLTTSDGYNFEPVDPQKPVVSTGGSEMDFDFNDQGDLYAVVRNEAGDGESWQSKVCTAPATDLANWKCVASDYKFDSPLAFTHKNEIYVIARLNVDGPYDKQARWMADSVETLYYLARYWWTPKRTALYRIDKNTLSAEVVLEFPSRGDTAFPGLVPLDDNRYLMFNYSSPPEGKDRVWMSGQLTGTQIYSTIINFE